MINLALLNSKTCRTSNLKVFPMNSTIALLFSSTPWKTHPQNRAQFNKANSSGLEALYTISPLSLWSTIMVWHKATPNKVSLLNFYSRKKYNFLLYGFISFVHSFKEKLVSEIYISNFFFSSP